MALRQITTLLLTAALLLGCAQRPAEHMPSSISSSAAVLPESSGQQSDSEPIILRTPQTVYIYRYFFDARNYEKKETTYTGALVLLPLINHIAEAAGFDVPLPILSTEPDGKGGIIIDFEKTLLSWPEQRDIYALLHTLTMTLNQNLSVGAVQFQVEGDMTTFGERFNPAPLVLAPGEPVDFTAILAGIPYEGRKTLSRVELPIAPPDDTAAEFASFLCFLGPIETNAVSPADLEPWQLANSCILATKYYLSVPLEGYPSGSYRKELTPVSDALLAKGIYEDMFWIADHVRQTARALYGNDFILQLSKENCRPYSYFESEGVITPSHRDGSYGLTPIILGYEALEHSYRIEAVYAYAHEDQDRVSYSVGTISDIPKEQLRDIVFNEGPRREIILKRASDGGLQFVSHRFL